MANKKIRNLIASTILPPIKVLGYSFCLLVSPAFANEMYQLNTQDEKIIQLEKILEEKRAHYHIPGMAIAVIKNDQVILSKGFGMMDVENKKHVTPETLFAIASTTKGFTSTMVGMLVDQNKVEWDDEITEYLPDYVFKEKGENLPITIRDILAHKTGWGRNNDILWASGTSSREFILDTVTKSKPLGEFRNSFQYSNVMYLAVGEAMAKLSELSWDDLLEQLIFIPLDMNDSTSIDKVVLQNPNLSKGYSWNDKTKSHYFMPRRNLNNIAPAGGIYSNIKDMTQWLLFLLNHGKVEGQQLISKEQLRATHEPQNSIPEGVDYGMGWIIEEWKGQKVVQHNGGIDGYGAQIALLPESNLGFVLLTNASPSPLLRESMELVWNELADTEVIDKNHVETADENLIDEIFKLRKTEQRKEALNKNAGFKLSGTVDFKNTGLNGKVTLMFDQKENYRQHITLGQFGEMLSVMNKDSAAMGGITPYTEFEGKYLKQMKLEHPAVGVDWRDYYDGLKVKSVSLLNDKKVYVLELTNSDIPMVTVYVDPVSGDTLKQENQFMDKTLGLIPITTLYDDYHEVGGLRLPLKVSVSNPYSGEMVFKYNDFETNQEFSSDLFTIKN